MEDKYQHNFHRKDKDHLVFFLDMPQRTFEEQQKDLLIDSYHFICSRLQFQLVNIQHQLDFQYTIN